MSEEKAQISRLKVGWVAPCVGIGGADAYMLGLMKHAQYLDCTGIAIADVTSVEQIEWVESYVGQNINFHQIGHNCPRFPNWNYYTDFAHAIYEATKDADIIISWGCKDARNHYHAIQKPIVELAQNEDDFSMEIVQDNDAFVDFRVAVSDASARVFGGKCDRIISNAIDPARVAPRYGREACRNMWGLKDRKVVTFLGRLVDEKNPGAIIAALAHLDQEWCGLFVGRGYRQDDLVKEIQRHLGGGRAYLAPPQAHIGDILAAADVFCLPSDFEGLPLSWLEALLAGTPTVCTEFTVVKELEQKFQTNLCISVPLKCPPNQLAEALQFAVSGDPKIDQMIAYGHQLVWDNFMLPTVTAQWEETLIEFYSKWMLKRSRMQVYEVGAATPLKTSKAHITVVDTSQEGISKWDKMKT